MKFFETASFHIVKPCNMGCKFCYATFTDFSVGRQLPIDLAKVVVRKLTEAGLQKITFAGGEPMLYKELPEIIRYSKSLGLTTSLITNGSLLKTAFLDEQKGLLDWIGISIDSLDKETNKKIGRVSKLSPNYPKLITEIKDRGYKLKINTVVNIFNEDESLQEFINWANPERWKIFDTLKVEGQNDTEYDAIKTSPNGFTRFLGRHTHPSLVKESNEEMTGSYLLIDPLGRLFENSSGKHTYSDSIVETDINTALSQINLNREMFEKRGGIYDW